MLNSSALLANLSRQYSVTLRETYPCGEKPLLRYFRIIYTLNTVWPVIAARREGGQKEGVWAEDSRHPPPFREQNRFNLDNKPP